MVRRKRTRFLVPLLRGFQWLIRAAAHAAGRGGRVPCATRRPRPCSRCSPTSTRSAGAVRQADPAVPVPRAAHRLRRLPAALLDGARDRRGDRGDRRRRAARPGQGVPARSASRAPRAWCCIPRFYPRGGRRSARRACARELGLAEDDFWCSSCSAARAHRRSHPLCAGLLAAAPAVARDRGLRRQPPALRGLAEVEARSGGRLHRLRLHRPRRRLLAAQRPARHQARDPALWPRPSTSSVPVVVSGNAHTIPQERFNARWSRSDGLGLVVRHWREMPAAAVRARRRRRPPGRDPRRTWPPCPRTAPSTRSST